MFLYFVYMIIKYEIFPKEGLLIQRYMEDFSLGHYKKYMEKLMKDPAWTLVEKVLTDARAINAKGALNNLDELVRFRKEVVKKNYLNVFLIDDPVSTATSYLYQFELKGSFNYEYCSTIEQARKLLGIKESNEVFEERLEQLQYVLKER